MATRQQRDMPATFKSFVHTLNPKMHAVAMRTRPSFVKGALAVAALAVVLPFSDIVLSHCFIALAVVSWGLWGFWGKLALQQSMPATSIFLAEALTGFVVGMILLAGLQLKGASMPWQRPWNIFGFLSGVGLAVGITCYYLALRTGKVSVIAPVTATYPAITVLLASVFLGERLMGIQWLGLGLTIVGCKAVTRQASRTTSGTPAGQG